MKIEEIVAGSFSELMRKVEEWKAAHPGIRVIHEDAPLSRGDLNFDKGSWSAKIEYEDPPSN